MSDVSEQPEATESSMAPLNPFHKWTRKDCLLLIIMVLIKFGDAVEAYLPGVITQKVSCELSLSRFQEGTLAVTLYVSWAISVLMAVPISKKLGDIATLLTSLYMSILFTALCAVVPNYYTLFLSRALTGFCIGLNVCTTGVIFAKHASSKEVLTQSSWLHGCIAFTLGGTWVSILGWLMLDLVNWRVFVVLTSIPLFVPPILMLHFCVNDVSQATDVLPSETDELIQSKPLYVPNFAIRVIKLSLFVLSNMCVGYGSIILLPWLIRNNKSNLLAQSASEDEKCKEVVQGNDFLILAAVTGGANVLGRLIGYLIWSRCKFLVLQSTIAVIIAVSYGTILAKPGMVAEALLLGVAKLCYSIQGVEVSIISFDYDYLGKSGLALGPAVVICSGYVGAVIGSSLAAFCDPYLAVLVTLVIVLLQILLICFMTERHNYTTSNHKMAYTPDSL